MDGPQSLMVGEGRCRGTTNSKHNRVGRIRVMSVVNRGPQGVICALMLMVLSVFVSGVAQAIAQANRELPALVKLGESQCNSPVHPVDSVTALELRDIAGEMERLAMEAENSWIRSLEQRRGPFEGTAKRFYSSAASVAEVAVELNATDFSARLLLASLEWKLAEDFRSKVVRSHAEAARRHAVCAVELATAAGDSAVIRRGEELVSFVHYYLVVEPRRQDSAYIARFLDGRGYISPEIRAARGKYYAVIAQGAGRNGQHLLALKRGDGDSVTLMTEPWQLTAGRVPIQVEWTTDEAGTVNGLLILFNALTGRQADSAMFQILDGMLAPIRRDTTSRR